MLPDIRFKRLDLRLREKAENQVKPAKREPSPPRTNELPGRVHRAKENRTDENLATQDKCNTCGVCFRCIGPSL
jgi:hypothetical protein